MKKLIFFDIDGTIISEDKEHIVPDSMYQALHRLQENGHLCFINTGRAWAEVDKKIRDMGFDGYVCGCGTHIRYQDEVLFSKSIPLALGNAILEDLRKNRLEWLLEGTDYVYYSAGEYQSRISLFRQEHEKQIPDAFRILAEGEEKNIVFDKFCICLTDDSQFEEFRQTYQNELTFIDRKRRFYEIIPNGYSKASGMQFLENHFHIDHKDTIAIGDSTNDLAMLTYAGCSIAMGGCAPELLPVADYVTFPLLEDGVYHAMEHYGLL